MKKIWLIPIFLIVEVLLFSFYFQNIFQKKLLLDFDLYASNLGQIEVFYNLGYGWSADNRLIVPNTPGQVNEHRISIDLPKYPRELRIDFGVDADSISITNLSIKNNANNLFSAKANYLETKDIDQTRFLSETELEILTGGGDPFIVFRTPAVLGFAKRFEVAGWLAKIVLLFLGILITLFIYNVFLPKIEVSNLVVWGFIGLISLALSNFIFGYVPVQKNEEQRRLASLPKYQNVLQFKNDLDAYLSDDFKLRPVFSFIQSIFKYAAFSISSQPHRVIAGEDSWLYLGLPDAMGDYRQNDPFPASDLKTISDNLLERKNWLESQGIHYLFVIAPNKQTIYPEYMARDYVREIGLTKSDQLLDYLQNKNLEILDLRKSLLQSKKEQPLYLFYKHDMHWNNVGGYYGYKEILNWCNEKFEELGPYSFTDFDTTSIVTPEGDLARAILLHKFLLRKDVEFELKNGIDKHREDYYQGLVNGEKWTVPSGNRKLLMFRDSYGENIIPFLSNHFQTSVFIWDQFFNAELILKEKPDMVIQQVAEIHLSKLLEKNPDIVNK